MKKICIITLHRVPNYGSVLQTFATQEVFRYLGFNTSIIDYIPDRFNYDNRINDEYKRFSFKYKNKIVFFLFSRIIKQSIEKQKDVFDGFLSSNLSLTKQYLSLEQLVVDPPIADIYCTGSDQVWNTKTNGFVEEPFYLSFIDDSHIKIAFSASFGRKEIPLEELQIIKPFLTEYYGIGIRERSGVDILSKMGINHVCNTLDPTLTVPPELWYRLCNHVKCDYENYILIYEFNHSELLHSVAHHLSKITGCKIIYISYWKHKLVNNMKYKTIFLPSVEEFLCLIKNASYVITNSFHAIAFSTVFNVKFGAVYPQSFSVRIDDYLNLIGLQDRHINTISQMHNLLLPIDYQKINGIIAEERNKTLSFLNGISLLEN